MKSFDSNGKKFYTLGNGRIYLFSSERDRLEKFETDLKKAYIHNFLLTSEQDLQNGNNKLILFLEDKIFSFDI